MIVIPTLHSPHPLSEVKLNRYYICVAILIFTFLSPNINEGNRKELEYWNERNSKDRFGMMWYQYYRKRWDLVYLSLIIRTY